MDKAQFMGQRVAPHAGAWIEIWINSAGVLSVVKSLPTRERGLK